MEDVMIVAAVVCKANPYQLALMVELANGEFADLAMWYSDESEFSVWPEDVQGKGYAQAREQIRQRDVRRIQSWV